MTWGSKRSTFVRMASRPGGGRINDREISHAGEGHLEGSRNRSGREGEHIHLGTELLQTLLVPNSKPLLFIDDDQAQVLELDTFL